MKYILAE